MSALSLQLFTNSNENLIFSITAVYKLDAKSFMSPYWTFCAPLVDGGFAVES